MTLETEVQHEYLNSFSYSIYKYIDLETMEKQY